MPVLVQGLRYCGCHLCEETLFEAWERMTYGGVRVQLHDLMPFSEYGDVTPGHRTVYVTR